MFFIPGLEITNRKGQRNIIALYKVTMTDQAIYGVLTKRWKQAGTPALTPHDFRRTFISSLLAKGVDLLTVQRMAGHSDPRTTSGYDLRHEEDMRTAATMLHLPYQSIMNSKS